MRNLLITCLSISFLFGCQQITNDNPKFTDSDKQDALMKQVVAGMQSKEQLMSMGMTEKMAENSIKTGCESSARILSTSNVTTYWINKRSYDTKVSTEDTMYRSIQCMKALGVNLTDNQINQMKNQALKQKERLDGFEIRNRTY